ncbi:F-box domain [Dillenia turbinata]|uniref:F-box domain n=1 Tax=Dillenia turbinata TaxID=194707 RepID=A0AAN8UPG5_9MAGN
MQVILPTLPDEIIADILSRVPVKSLVRFRCVSKEWCSLVANTKFIKAHLQRSNARQDHHRAHLSALAYSSCPSPDDHSAETNIILNFPPKFQNEAYRIVGSCDGLLLIAVDSGYTFLLNPSTREYKELPQPAYFPSNYELVTYGFGYDSSSDDYKVVRVCNTGTSATIAIGIEVYELKSNMWRNLQDCPRGSYFIYDEPGIFVSGAIHWILCRKNPEVEQCGDRTILCLDLKEEKFCELPAPDFGNIQAFIQNIGVSRGFLSIVVTFHEILEVQVMIQHGVKASWTKVISIPFFCMIMHDCISESSCGLRIQEWKELVKYNSQGKNERDVFSGNDVLNLLSYMHGVDAAIYVESLVCPHGNGETSQANT